MKRKMALKKIQFPAKKRPGFEPGRSNFMKKM